MSNHHYATHWRQAAPMPVSLKGKLRKAVRNAALSVSAMFNKTQDDTFLRGLYCHYVFDDQKDEFERLIIELKQNGEFVDTDTFIQMLKGEKPIDRRYYHLSFDDGFRNNYTNAYPILKKHGVPAIFFIPSSIIEADYQTVQHYCLDTTKYRDVIEMMSWSEVQDLIANGYEIGSHTKTHARFTEISANQALMEDEIIGSKKDLEKQLDIECKYISWPYGELKDADAESLEMVKRAGYIACFGAYRGSVKVDTTDIFSIPRHHFEVQWPDDHVYYFARGNREVAI